MLDLESKFIPALYSIKLRKLVNVERGFSLFSHRSFSLAIHYCINIQVLTCVVFKVHPIEYFLS